MAYEIIASSSKGNAILVNDYFLLDCGVPFSKIKPYLDRIKVIFISHEHSQTILKKVLLKNLLMKNLQLSM